MHAKRWELCKMRVLAAGDNGSEIEALSRTYGTQPDTHAAQSRLRCNKADLSGSSSGFSAQCYLAFLVPADRGTEPSDPLRAALRNLKISQRLLLFFFFFFKVLLIMLLTVISRLRVVTRTFLRAYTPAPDEKTHMSLV